MTDRATRFASRIPRKEPPLLKGRRAMTVRGAAPPPG